MQEVLFITYIGIIVFSIVFLGTTVLVGAKKQKSAKLFAGLSFITAAWVLANSLVANYKDSSLVNLVEVATYIDLLLAIPLVSIYWYFVSSLNTSSSKSKTFLYISRVIIPALATIATLVIVSGNAVYFIEEPEFIIKYTNLFDIYSLTIALIFSLTLVRLVRLIVKNKGAERTQYKYLFAGIATAGVLLFASNVLYPIIAGVDNRIITNASYLGLLVFLFMTSRAILVHKLFNIKLVVAKSVAYAASLVILAIIFIGTSLLIVGSILDQDIPMNVLSIFALISLITALAFQPLKHFFDKFTNSIFYRDAYDGQEFLNAINAKIVKSNDLYTLLTETAEDIKTTIKVNNVSFYIDSSAAIDFHTAGTNTSLFAHVEWAEVLNELNALDKKVISAESLEVDEKTLQKMRKLNIELVMKMTSKDEDVGYMILSERKSGTNFGLQDIQVLEIIADELAITVQNAVQLEQIAQFNVTLQRKIDNATNELQQSNEKLVKLDEAKDEFISMASHQLRTPLTSVKGYISMILEGDAGDINETQKKFLDQAYISSQRMVYLIADLLNVSRLKTGKFVIEKAPTYLPDVIESEVSQLYGTAEARDLKMVFHKPDSFPTIDLDETKIRQVIMNFADNAIYYTPHGGKITIALKKLKNSIEYTVTDTGIGVPKAEQHHLFNKFYRAANAKKARPDGTGLGLYMAKKVVVAQGGAIIFKTTEGKGSTFGFSFPLPKDAPKEESEEKLDTEDK